jgi:hypothetical protein
MVRRIKLVQQADVVSSEDCLVDRIEVEHGIILAT